MLQQPAVLVVLVSIFGMAASAETLAPPQGIFIIEHSEKVGRLSNGAELSFVGNLTFLGSYDAFSGWAANPAAGIEYSQGPLMLQFFLGVIVEPGSLFSSGGLSPVAALRGQYKSSHFSFWTTFEYTFPQSFYNLTRVYGLWGPVGLGADADVILFLDPTMIVLGGGPSLAWMVGDKMSLGLSWRWALLREFAPDSAPQIFSYPRLYGVIIF